ncbi:hypothetical protein IWW40_003458 [Coemansia sp. RSA 1250]|nr:hypothetical protein IWW40_003458 [Coemansia sp. RSA 1250]
MAGFLNANDVEHEFMMELQAHQYGIKTFTAPRALCDQHLRVESQLTLLKGEVIGVQLDKRGYVMTSTSAEHLTKYLNQPFETFTGMLVTISSEFQQAMHGNLQAKLAALAHSQGEPSALDPS